MFLLFITALYVTTPALDQNKSRFSYVNSEKKSYPSMGFKLEHSLFGTFVSFIFFIQMRMKVFHGGSCTNKKIS